MQDRIVALVVVGVVMAIATVTDLRERRVPLWLTTGSIAAGLVTAALGGTERLLQGVIGMVVGGLLLAPFIVIGWVRGQEGIGGGDALLLAVVGTWMGWAFVISTAWWASLAGGVLALIALWRTRSLHTGFPYVPALALGAVGAVFLPLGIGRG